MKTRAERVAELEARKRKLAEKEAQLVKRLRAEKAKAGAEARRARTHGLIVLGGVIVKMIEAGKFGADGVTVIRQAAQVVADASDLATLNRVIDEAELAVIERQKADAVKAVKAVGAAGGGA